MIMKLGNDLSIKERTGSLVRLLCIYPRILGGIFSRLNYVGIEG